MAPVVNPLDTAHLVALAAALGWASGLRLYAVLLITGLVGYAGWVPLPDGLRILQNPVVLGVAGFMFVVEFLADKIPGVDTLWDLIHTFIRIPAGALLASSVFGGVFGGDQATWAMVAALLGGTLAATSHAAKATTRAAANTLPEPFSNLSLSFLEDGLVVAAMWLSTTHPVTFFAALAVAVVAMVAVTVVLFRFLRLLLGRLGGLMGRAAEPAS